MTINSLIVNKQSWDEVAHRFYGRNPLPEFGPLASNEEDLNLFGDVSDLKILEIGCGSGHSLNYLDSKNALELWGLDLSETQIGAARELLSSAKTPITLFESPMEENPGVPVNYFDIVFSIYALGWTADLNQTVKNVHSYLKQGGVFIFSWEHPLYNRVKNVDGTLMFAKSYHEEGPYEHEAWSHPAIMQQSKISTYINTLVENGFMIEKVVEDACISERDIQRHANSWYSYEKTQYVPTTLVIKVRKL